ncbi:MAG: penicillin acylase family protein, partial [Natronospirillum sp.]
VFYLHGSFPQLDGTLIVPGLRAKVELERDAQGIPTLSAIHREDIAYGLGFLHAQERFFQMDLQRRQAAGETAALLGSSALIDDRSARRHNFRQVARQSLADATVEQAGILAAYTQGVNQGLVEMRQPPMEYLLLGQHPEPWHAVDSLLVLLNQSQVLQHHPIDRQLSEHYFKSQIPEDWRDFFAQGNVNGTPSLPNTPLSELISDAAPAVAPVSQHTRPGGHQWAISGALTPQGKGALLATDVHQPQTLPTPWYRANWRLPETNRMARGVTLPGNPVLFMGSNEQLSWVLAPSRSQNARLIRLEVDNNSYRTPSGWKPFRERRERIAVQGSVAQEMMVRDTDWGPVVGQDEDGRWLVLHWAAHDPGALNLNLHHLEQLSDVDAALLDLNIGLSAQHLMVADHRGAIGWTQVGAWSAVASGTILDGADTDLA